MRNRTITITTPNKIFSCELGKFYTNKHSNGTYSIHNLVDYHITIIDDDFDIFKEQLEYNLTKVDNKDILIKL